MDNQTMDIETRRGFGKALAHVKKAAANTVRGVVGSFTWCLRQIGVGLHISSEILSKEAHQSGSGVRTLSAFFIYGCTIFACSIAVACAFLVCLTLDTVLRILALTLVVVNTPFQLLVARETLRADWLYWCSSWRLSRLESVRLLDKYLDFLPAAKVTRMHEPVHEPKSNMSELPKGRPTPRQRKRRPVRPQTATG